MAKAYSSISNRQPNEDISAEGISNELDDGDDLNPASSDPVPAAAAANPAIKAAILASQAKAAAPPGAPAIDPLLADYNQRQQQLDVTRQGQARANTISNIGQALSQVAQGANTPTPNTDLYKNIEAQNAVMSKGAEEDMDRRQRVFNMIEQRNSREQMHDDSLASRAQIASDALEGRRALASSNADTKSSDKQNKFYDNMVSKAESYRGSPAGQQAEKDLYASDKAKSLANLYGDPNKLSNAQVQLLASEVAKIASGGVPTQHELDGLTPGTLQGALSGFVSKLTNKPTPANAAAFIKAYQDYANVLTKDAQKVIKDRYGRISDSYGNMISPEQADTFNKTYTNRFGGETTPPAGNAGKLVNHNGKMYRVGPDGDSLEEAPS